MPGPGAAAVRQVRLAIVLGVPGFEGLVGQEMVLNAVAVVVVRTVAG